jgi:hypothetical protein
LKFFESRLINFYNYDTVETLKGNVAYGHPFSRNLVNYFTYFGLNYLGFHGGNSVMIDCGSKINFMKKLVKQYHHDNKIICYKPQLSNTDSLHFLEHIDKFTKRNTIVRDNMADMNTAQ